MFRFLRRTSLPVALALSCLPALSLRARAVITFDARTITISSAATTQASSMTIQAIIPKAGGGYRMYMTSDSYRVMSATSSDLVSWTMEDGIRLSTSSDIDASSITSVGVFVSTNAADNFLRMYYVGVSTAGFYRILSATSTDGLTWSKETSTHVIKNGGKGFLDSPRPFAESTSLLRLYYVADDAGANARSNYRVYTASSNDGGLTFTDDGALLSSDIAYQVSVTTLTDGRTRLYYCAPLSGQTTGSQVLSAVAASGSRSFVKESGVRYSTTSSAVELSYPVVVRSTESFRWRMLHTLTPGGSTAPFAASALTSSPTIVSFTPSSLRSDNASVAITVTGEIFSSPAPTLAFATGGDSLNAASVVRTNDLELTGTVNPFGRTLGPWTLTLTNADGALTQLSPAFNLTIAPANVTLLDNLFRPNAGGRVSVTVKTFAAGHVVIQLYSQSGQLLKTLLDEHRPADSVTTTWDGRTVSGHVVASGVYYLRIAAPGAETLRKVVVIK